MTYPSIYALISSSGRQRIRHARIVDGRSVQVLATLANISVNYWYQIELNKRSRISEDVLKSIEPVLRVDFGVKFDA